MTNKSAESKKEFPIWLTLLLLLIVFIGLLLLVEFIIWPRSEFLGIVQKKLSSFQKEQINLFVENVKLLITLSTLIFGVIGTVVIKIKIFEKWWKRMVLLLCVFLLIISIWSGFKTLNQILLELRYSSFSIGDIKISEDKTILQLTKKSNVYIFFNRQFYLFFIGSSFAILFISMNFLFHKMEEQQLCQKKKNI